MKSRFVAPNVVGSAELLAKKSAVNEHGQLRHLPVDGVSFRPTRPVPHEDGFLTEVVRASWDMMADQPVSQMHITTTFPERIRAWGLHHVSIDRLFVVTGLVKIGRIRRTPRLAHARTHDRDRAERTKPCTADRVA
jgi:hypothetical protein